VRRRTSPPGVARRRARRRASRSGPGDDQERAARYGPAGVVAASQPLLDRVIGPAGREARAVTPAGRVRAVDPADPVDPVDPA
jgi:hypothetical protein